MEKLTSEQKEVVDNYLSFIKDGIKKNITMTKEELYNYLVCNTEEEEADGYRYYEIDGTETKSGNPETIDFKYQDEYKEL